MVITFFVLFEKALSIYVAISECPLNCLPVAFLLRVCLCSDIVIKHRFLVIAVAAVLPSLHFWLVDHQRFVLQELLIE